MNTPLQELEDQLRTSYQQEFGDPSSAAALWSKIAHRLPVQHQPLTWWQRVRQAFPPFRVTPSVPRLERARRRVMVGSLLCVLLCLSGLVYAAGTFWSSQTHAVVGTPASPSSADALLLTQLLRSNPQQSIQQLAQSDQFGIHQTQTLNANTVTLQKLLADANNIVLGYTIDGNTPLSPAQGALGPTITLPDGQTLSGAHTVYKSRAGSANGPTISPPVAVLAVFNLASMVGNPQHLTLQIAIPAGGATAHFQVTVPFYAGKTITLHQTATSHGQRMTLERVVITPSEARFFYTTGSTDLSPLIWRLSIAGKTYMAYGGYDGGFRTGGENSTGYWENLQNDTGTWTVQASIPPALGQGSWQFTFAVA